MYSNRKDAYRGMGLAEKEDYRGGSGHAAQHTLLITHCATYSISSLYASMA